MSSERPLREKLNILVIAINYSPEPTGSAPYTAGLAEMLAEEGHHVEAFVGIPHYPWWSVLSQDRFRLRHSENRNNVQVRHYRHFVPGKQTMLRRVAWEFTFYVNVLASIPKNRPELIIASTPSLSGALLGVFFSKKYRIPLITVVQDVVGEAVTKSGLKVGSTIGKIVGSVERVAFRNSSRVCVASPSFKQYVVQSDLRSDRIILLPNWSHIPSPTKSREESRSAFGWGENDITVLHTGNMGLKQDLGNLVRTAKLFQNEPNYRFILCGDGNQKSKLEKLAKGISTIEFMSPVSHSEYPNLLSAADILIVNERDSVGDMSLPSKLTSYLLAGKPIIAAVSGGGACAVELKKTGGAAVVVPPNRPDLLSTAVRNLINSPHKAQKMSEAGLAYANKVLTKEIARERILRIIHDLMGDSEFYV